MHLGPSGGIAQSFVNSKLTPLLVIASILLGAMAVLLLPREEEPQIKVPMVNVMVGMPGASAKEVEERVVRPMEQLLWEIQGVEYVYSTAMSASGGEALAEDADRRGTIGPMPSHSIDYQQPISLHPDWTQRWEGRRCWITTPRQGEHLAMRFRPGNDAASGDPQGLLDDFIPRFAASASSPSRLGLLAAERVIGKGVSRSGNVLIGVALLAPTASGTLILASRGVDAALPGRFRDLMVMSTFV